MHEWWRISFAQLSGTWREGYCVGTNELWVGDMWMDLLRWDENWRWFVFHINDHQWHSLLCIVIQIDLWSTLWVLVFLHPFQFMPIGLMNKVDIMSGTQHFPPTEISIWLLTFSSVQFSSVAQSCLTLCDPMNHSTPGLPVHHQLPESTQTHVHCRWCHLTISSSVIPFSSCPQSLPASVSFPMSQLFTWGGQSIGVSALASVLPMNTQDWSPLGWTGWISLQSKGLSRVFSNTTVQKHQFFGAQLSL